MNISNKKKRIEVLKTNVPLWNRWRNIFNPEIDLRRADLRRADLRSADLRRADLRRANLYNADLRSAVLDSADLRSADLRSANLHGANLDYSSGIPLWCGGQNIKIDTKQARQIVAHAFAQECDDEEYNKLRELVREFCNKSHIAEHLDWLKEEDDERKN